MVRPINFFILILIAASGACNHLRFSAAVTDAGSRWNMYGGNPGRWNVATDSVSPPLDSAWEFDAGAGFSWNSAAAADGRLVLGNLNGEIILLGCENGVREGLKRFGPAISGTPVIDGDIIYVSLSNQENGIIAYNMRKGKTIWSAPVGSVESALLLVDGKIYCSTEDGCLVSVDMLSGAVDWKFRIDAKNRKKLVHSSPASDGTFVIFGADDGNLYAVSAKDGELKWKKSTGKAIVCSPSVRNGTAFVGSQDSTFYALDINTGRTIWSQCLGAGMIASQAVDDRSVYVGTIDGTLYSLGISDGTVKWQMNSGSIIVSPPVISGDVLYVGALNKMLYALDRASGAVVWQFQAEGRIRTSPLVFGKKLFVFTEDRTVIAFREKKLE